MNGKRFLVIGLSVALGGVGAAAFAGGGDDDKHKDKDKTQDTLGETEPIEKEGEVDDKTTLGEEDTIVDEEDATLAAGRATKNVDAMVSKWSETSRQAAREVIEKYGQPDEMTPTMLVWHDNGPWKKTIVYKEGVAHDFPQPHTDVVEQFIDYKVPADKFDELAAYDGSVIARRTAGVISSHCGDEAMNFLALNLADDVAKGEKDVDEAQAEYAQAAMRYTKAKKDMKAKGAKTAEIKKGLPKDTIGFTFDVADGNTGDPGEAFKAAAEPATKRPADQPASESQPATPRRY